MKKLILIIPILLWSQLYGQVVDVPADTAKRDSLVIKYLLSSDLSFTAGNLFSFTTVNKGQLDIERRVIGTRIQAGFMYGFIDTAVVSNELTTSIMISLFPRNIVYGFINGGFERSFLRGINYRAYGGIGAGFRVVKTENHEFEPYVNLLYEFNRYNTPLPGDTISPYELQTLRGVVGWNGLHKVFRQKLIILHNAKYAQSLTIANNFRIEGNINFAFPLIKVLSLKTGFSLTYENVVPIGRKQADFLWTMGIILSNM